WTRWQAVYPQVRVAVLEQTHGSRVHVVRAAERPGRKIGDGMVTSAPGIVLAIFTADCVPVLMFDDQARVAGALHAGWRGTLAGLPAEGMKTMMGQGARARCLRVALGPSIGSCCFEVDSELADRFVLQIPPASGFCREGRPGKKYLDLRGILLAQ